MSDRYDNSLSLRENGSAVHALMRDFDLQLVGYDPSIAFCVPGCKSAEQMSTAGAQWLLNILQELSDYRNGKL